MDEVRRCIARKLVRFQTGAPTLGDEMTKETLGGIEVTTDKDGHKTFYVDVGNLPIDLALAVIEHFKADMDKNSS